MVRWSPITLTVRRLAVANPSEATSATLMRVTIASAMIRLARLGLPGTKSGAESGAESRPHVGHDGRRVPSRVNEYDTGDGLSGLAALAFWVTTIFSHRAVVHVALTTPPAS